MLLLLSLSTIKCRSTATGSHLVQEFRQDSAFESLARTTIATSRNIVLNQSVDRFITELNTTMDRIIRALPRTDVVRTLCQQLLSSMNARAWVLEPTAEFSDNARIDAAIDYAKQNLHADNSRGDIDSCPRMQALYLLAIRVMLEIEALIINNHTRGRSEGFSRAVVSRNSISNIDQHVFNVNIQYSGFVLCRHALDVLTTLRACVGDIDEGFSSSSTRLVGRTSTDIKRLLKDYVRLLCELYNTPIGTLPQTEVSAAYLIGHARGASHYLFRAADLDSSTFEEVQGFVKMVYYVEVILSLLPQ